MQEAYTSTMDSTVITALISGVSAVVGGVITAIGAPLVKHWLEQCASEKNRKREQIAKWRQMLLDVNLAAGGNISPGSKLHLHPEYIALEPLLTEAARKVVRAENRTIVVGQALSVPLETLKNEIARIESQWGLGK